MRNCSRSLAVLTVVWLVAGAASMPVRRSPDLEARRRSAIDRSMIRFGRSYPPEPSAADIREAFQRPTRRGNSFLRLGRSQPVTLTTDDLISLLRNYEEEYDTPSAKRATQFIRFGRDPKFIRLGRSADEDKALGFEHTSDLMINGSQQRKSRARDHFVRFGRDSEEIGDLDEDVEERRKRSTEACSDCQA